MRNKSSTSSDRIASLLLVICFTVSLLFCGDADCLNGNSNEDCASLLCSLLNKHDASSSHDSFRGAGKDCSCVCHLPAVIPPVFGFDYHPLSLDNSLTAVTFVPAAPVRLVYHPPATA
ncbi:MAG: hypothetical protein ONB44_08560 [candidate division KSB1 bacterium]|nr:hypothetical protein [candidate division KSB1 bacterium]MDZ7302181.1 hypothetical protein [candidate division KSB1 bacterium]MDZ7311290.1 hypothetical protein [candidate division KSB1 bacterium]